MTNVAVGVTCGAVGVVLVVFAAVLARRRRWVEFAIQIVGAGTMGALCWLAVAPSVAASAAVGFTAFANLALGVKLSYRGGMRRAVGGTTAEGD
jgi:hypothetical protein